MNLQIDGTCIDASSSMFLLYFTNAMQSSITSNLYAYITSGFDSHSLIPVIDIVSNVMAGAAYLPVAKTLNVWGRPVGFSVMTGIAIIGLILSATCSNITTYCAAQVSKNCLLPFIRSLRKRNRSSTTLVSAE